jgi:hypothetical protein
LTRRRFPGSFSAVSFLRRFIAVALLALWLPATLHCALEAAGFDELFHCAADHHSSCEHEAPADATRDACDIIEGSAFKPAANSALLPPPVLSAHFLIFTVPPVALDLTPPPSGLDERILAPPEVARTWHFVARAALPARAPSSLS